MKGRETMDDLQKMTGLVKEILTQSREARNSDDELYYIVCSVILEEQHLDPGTFPLSWALLRREDFALPKYETVRRTRQKVQAKHPELRSTKAVSFYRAEREKVYRAYARGERICF